MFCYPYGYVNKSVHQLSFCRFSALILLWVIYLVAIVTEPVRSVNTPVPLIVVSSQTIPPTVVNAINLTYVSSTHDFVDYE